MDFDRYMENWDEFEEYIKKHSAGKLDELKEKYANIDEDFAEALFDEWDDMNLRCNWNCIIPRFQKEIIDEFEKDWPGFFNQEVEVEEEAPELTPEQLEAIRMYEEI